MNPEERDRMNAICFRIQTERDPKIFDELLRQLNELLFQKRQRTEQDRPSIN